MHALFFDVKLITQHRVKHDKFDEVLFADDTTRPSTNEVSVAELLNAMELQGAK